MLKVAVVLLIVMLAYGGIYSLMNVFMPKTVMSGSFKAITGKDVENADADHLKALMGSYRYMGIYALATVISGFFVLFAGFQKAQKWSWWCFLIVGGIMWLWGVVNTAVIGDNLNLIMHIVGIVIFLVGILLPVKEFFTGGTEEAL